MSDQDEHPDRAPGLLGGETGFRTWAAGRLPQLRRRAFLLCGDWHTADDLVQETLARVYARWARVDADRNPDGYAARILLSRYLDLHRRPWRRERATATPPDSGDPHADRDFDAVDARDQVLLAALAELSPDHRAVIVLRFVEDRSVDQVAELLQTSTGTVKSRTARGLDSMRAALVRHGHEAAIALEIR